MSGCAYLVYLGIRLWRPPAVLAGAATAGNGRRPVAMLCHAFLVTALNPKSLAFFVAFLPQFMRPADPLLPQMLALESTFILLATLNATLYAALATRLRGAIGRPSVLKALNRTGGAILIGAGLATAAMKRG